MEKVVIHIAGLSKAINAERNGSCFIVDQKPTFPIFPADVEIENPADRSGIVMSDFIPNAMLVECYSIDGRYWFSFREMDPEEVRNKRIAELEEAICELSMMEG